MTKFNWKVTDMYTLNEGALTDYLVTVLYEVTGVKTVNKKDYEAQYNHYAKFEVVKNDKFVPYSELKNDTVIGWIKNKIGENGIKSIEANINSLIESEINPPVRPQNTPLPVDFNN